VSIIAGIFSRNRNTSVKDEEVLINLLACRPDDVVDVLDYGSCFLAKVDYGIFGSPAFEAREESATVVAGEPRLGNTSTRSDDTKSLGASWRGGDQSAVRTARGVFCAAHYNTAEHELLLVADKLGNRPLYYHVGPEYVVFASALWILEKCPGVPKRVDVRAAGALTVLGYVLGNATPYLDIKCLLPAEVVKITQHAVESSRYWRWDTIAQSSKPEQELLAEAYAAFASATDGMARHDKAACSFLSGGMDSRCVVSAVSQRGMKVHTTTFAMDGSQEQRFAAAYAERAGVHRHEAPYDRRPGESLAHMFSRWMEANPWGTDVPDRPRLVWAGDGGSVGLGCVYISPAMVDLLRASNAPAAIRRHLDERYAHPVLRILHPAARQEMDGVPEREMLQEFDAIQGDDPVQRFYLLLMFGDQRRHLYGLYEEIHLHRIELALPFFDSDFLRVIASVPVDLRLYHRFYTKWMYLFDAAVTATPWQTYPGHEPCPVPADNDSLSYQWAPETFRRLERIANAETRKEVVASLFKPNFPSLLSRAQILISVPVHRLGLRNYDSLFKAARSYLHYCACCDSDAPRLAGRPGSARFHHRRTALAG
jgi:asparagine synthase (glutamine-hydrolysing)